MPRLSRVCLASILNILAMILPHVAFGQEDVQGVKLGVTTVRQLQTIRNDPAESGKTVDGWEYISFGNNLPKYTYYFSPDDSIVEWARVFVKEGYTVTRVREALGRPDTTTFGEDLSKQQTFKSGGIIVAYKPNGEVSYIEYHPRFPYGIVSRRFQVAVKIRDSVIAAALLQQHPDITIDQAMDSVNQMILARGVRSRAKDRKAVSRRILLKAARLDSLCAH